MSALRLRTVAPHQRMRQSLAKDGQLTPVQAYPAQGRLEVFDGLKRLQAARELRWPVLRVEVHDVDGVGAKHRALKCNAGGGISELEEGWLVQSLYREDQLSQPQIAVLLGCHKSWVCRRLALVECTSEAVAVDVRLGLLSVTAARELARLPRGNQDEVGRVVAQRGLATRQTARLVEQLLAAPAAQWPQVLATTEGVTPRRTDGSASRFTPVEQLISDSSRMKRLATRVHSRLLERSVESLGEPASQAVRGELKKLGDVLKALTKTMDARLGVSGDRHEPS